MRLSLWKPISQCAALILDKKEKQRDPADISDAGLVLRRVLENRLREAQDQASEDGSLSKTREMDVDLPPRSSIARSRSMARLEAQRDFLRATAAAADRVFDSLDSIPDQEEALAKFLAVYEKFQSTHAIDRLRSEEYSHINGSKVCLDYCGFGLFSYFQTLQLWESSAFSLSEISVNLSNHVLYGGADPGTAEHDIKARIMEYLNIPESDYGLVFTVSRGSAFKLLSDCYPFQSNPRLLTMLDYESQSVNWMAQAAREKGAKTYSAWFRFPSMKLCGAELRKKIVGRRRRRKRGGAAGLFVFPVQSRVSGTKYSYQWMALAQQNHWHVLLDAGALAPKDMDSLGLSLFRPDFIVTSFYRVFGHDPTGFGCLLIKKSMITNLKSTNGGIGTGMVRIVPEIPQYLSNPDDEALPPSLSLPAVAFSGAFTSSQVKDVFEGEVDHEDSSENSMGDMMRSPAFSEDDSSENSNSLWIDLGQSPHSGASPLPPSWIAGRRQFPTAKISFDAALLSMSQELPEIQEEQALPEISEDGAAKFRRETEHEFRLLDGREGKNPIVFDEVQSLEEEEKAEEEDDRRDPEIICRHLDQVGSMGLNKTTLRLRYLVNWLVTSLLQLRLPGGSRPLVQIYGPKIKYERGPAVAFNIIRPNGSPLDPEMVQKLAEREGISLGIGFLSHVKAGDGKKALSRLPVVSASLGFLTNFEDVFRTWAFVTKFLDPEFSISGGIGDESRVLDVMSDES